ncbi:hypothetical protein GT037_002519 [Alternaria burnsii]|uniref:Uncharacterized protein n=1 Tax=Alternaria burnsii TaxID=1187904 RepID=A0A8H7EJA4_9PLEO|nr:uncharacterized protein GT037_002519 [Alternaria burnsii]KAF7680868.1 hypothetical protein GT037_002519 [Alternaria burnsii]
MPNYKQVKDLVLPQKQTLPALKVFYIALQDEGLQKLVRMTLDPVIQDDRSDMEDTLIRTESVTEIPDPIKTKSHGWRPYVEKPHIRWAGHKYVLEPGERSVSEFHHAEANEIRSPEMYPWLTGLIGNSAQLVTDDISDLSVEEEDYGREYMIYKE